MSLLNLVHKDVIIKFTDSAKNQFNPEAGYVFRLAGVDGMGFLLIQNLESAGESGHQAAADPYWINKDLVREIHELTAENLKGTLYHDGKATKPAKAPAAKPPKGKTPAKPKAV